MVSIVDLFRHFTPRPAIRIWNNGTRDCRKNVIPGSESNARDRVREISPRDRAKPIAVYCARGASSAAAAKLLQKLGYQNVYSLKGGIFGWLEAGGVLQTCKRR